MNDNNDITQRSFWNIPAPDSIIQTHYGKPSEHVIDAAGYYLESSHLVPSYLERRETILPNKVVLNEFQKEVLTGKRSIYSGGIGAGKTFLINILENFGQRESDDDFYKRVAFMTGETFEEVKKRYENKTTEDNQA